MHWWDIGEIAGWVCHYCHIGRAPNNDPVETYRKIRRRLETSTSFHVLRSDGDDS